MMATLTRFDAAKYAALTTPDPSKVSDDPDDVTGMIGLADLPKLLRDQYSPVACHKWRSRGSDEGGYGPVGTPAPDKIVSRGGAAAQPYWYPSRPRPPERLTLETPSPALAPASVAAEGPPVGRGRLRAPGEPPHHEGFGYSARRW
jgi:hypothetical protein